MLIDRPDGSQSKISASVSSLYHSLTFTNYWFVFLLDNIIRKERRARAVDGPHEV